MHYKVLKVIQTLFSETCGALLISECFSRLVWASNNILFVSIILLTIHGFNKVFTTAVADSWVNEWFHIQNKRRQLWEMRSHQGWYLYSLYTTFLYRNKVFQNDLVHNNVDKVIMCKAVEGNASKDSARLHNI